MDQVSRDICVVAEYIEDEITDLTKEILGIVKQLASECESRLCAILLGSNANKLITQLSFYGADCVYVNNQEELKNYNLEVYVEALANFITAFRPQIIVCSMSVNGRELANRLAARLRLPFFPACTGVKILSSTKLKVTRLIDHGTVQALSIVEGLLPIVVAMLPEIRGIEEPDTSRGINAKTVKLEIPENLRVQHITTYISDVKEIDLTEADTVICGGNGMGSKSNFELLEKLGELIGSPIGGSRIALDKGWIKHEQMVGATGKILRSNLYLAFGISGAIQHVIGIKDCKTIIAVNKDPRAEIMQKADIAFVADVNELLPLLIERLDEYSPKI